MRVANVVYVIYVYCEDLQQKVFQDEFGYYVERAGRKKIGDPRIVYAGRYTPDQGSL